MLSGFPLWASMKLGIASVGLKTTFNKGFGTGVNLGAKHIEEGGPNGEEPQQLHRAAR